MPIRRYGPVELIGCHGQTIYHEGGANTLQIGEAAVIAERTGVPVVSDFRAARHRRRRPGRAAGALRGLPAVPPPPTRARMALNIGGIANITVIPPGAAPGDVVAFDTGPGNMVIDALARARWGCRSTAAGGSPRQEPLIARCSIELLADPYYRRPPPKTAGREQYGARVRRAADATGWPLLDLIATATALTAATVRSGWAGRRPAPLT